MLYQPNGLEQTTISTIATRIIDQWLKPLFAALVFILAVNLFFPRYAVMGHSMEPGLHENDRLFVSNIEVAMNALSRGEIVVFTAPGDNETVIKRVIGLPGETVTIDNGVVYIDGASLREDYIRERTHRTGEWVVGENQYFVLGDNRNNSRDSSQYGPIDASRISGVVKFRFWPLNAFDLFHVPQY